jgi:predicted enzyme related to lactoylglutathione lyase
VINVPSIDEDLKKIEKAGGKVVWTKSPVGDFGFYAQVADTEGNVVGLWEDVKKSE